MTEFDILVQQVNACTRCELSRTRHCAVPGDGSRNAQVVFVGEGPGFYEDREGKPFVGQAGQLLTQLLLSIGLKRQDVYITNMVKCRPPNNRDPLPAELEACRPFLDKQIEMIRPKVIVTLGRHSFGKFFPGELISRARGRPRRWNETIVFPMYHPAAALHQPNLRPALEADFKKLSDLLSGAPAKGPQPAQDRQAPIRQPAPPKANDKPSQLSFF